MIHKGGMVVKAARKRERLYHISLSEFSPNGPSPWGIGYHPSVGFEKSY